MRRVIISGTPKETDVKSKNTPPHIHFTHTPITAARNASRLITSWRHVVRSGTFLYGKEHAALTKTLRQFLGAGRVIPVASGHDALYVSFSALGLNKADEILVPANSPYTAFPVALTPAKLTLYDVHAHGVATVAEIEKRCTKKTKALVVTHLYGLIADMDAIRKFTKSHKLILVEDVAQGFGGTWKGRKLGTLGDIGCFSFYPTKNLGSTGDAGAVWVRNKNHATIITHATRYGAPHKYDSHFLSGHSRIPELTAASINVFFDSFESVAKKRSRVASWYDEAFASDAFADDIRVLSSHPGSHPVRHLYVIDVPKRNVLQQYLASRHIPTLIHYPVPVHLIPSFRYLKHKRGDFPVSERLSKRIISLPFHEHLTRIQVGYVIRSIRSFYA